MGSFQQFMKIYIVAILATFLVIQTTALPSVESGSSLNTEPSTLQARQRPSAGKAGAGGGSGGGGGGGAAGALGNALKGAAGNAKPGAGSQSPGAGRPGASG